MQFEWRQGLGKAGNKGDTGGAGATGPVGAQGPQGEPGAKGDTGPIDTVHYGSHTNEAPYNGKGAEVCAIGEILLTAGTYSGGLPANGQSLPISAWEALYASIGNKFGSVDSNHFYLPDLRAIVPNNMTYYICVEGTFVPGPG